jgi:hypothetical protein
LDLRRRKCEEDGLTYVCSYKLFALPSSEKCDVMLGSTKGIDQSTGFGQYGQPINKFVYKNLKSIK